jgi:hypothetical protein
VPLRLQGRDGAIRWGYYPAATLRPWSVTPAEAGGPAVLTASIVSSDAYRLAQQPLVFVTSHAAGVWRWPIVTLQITGASLTATLGPKEL